MKVFFDARYIRTDFHDGISRYSAEMAQALAKLHDDLTFIISDEAQIAHLPRAAKTVRIHRNTSPLELFTARILNRYHPDVVFSPMQTMGSRGRKFKLILTLHDLIYYRHRTPPHNLNPLIRAGWWLYHATYVPQRMVLNHADCIATVSQTSKKEILAAHLTKRPIIVTYNAPQNLAAHLDAPFTPTTAMIPKNLIYMGSFMEYKNVETLIKGLQYLPGYTLHLLSRITPTRKAQLQALIPKQAQVVFHNGVSDDTYAQLLTTQALAVSASFDEGFGIPVAEALVLGVPAVISDTAIFHEVAGDAAYYFDPTRPERFADAVHAASQPGVYAALSQKGKAQVQKFSWDTSAGILLSEMQRLYSKH